MFSNYPDKHYRHTNHNYRSVLARRIIKKIDRAEEPGRYGRAVQAILKHNHREPNDFSLDHMRFMDVYVIECDFDHVTAKTEHPVYSPEDVPFITLN